MQKYVVRDMVFGIRKMIFDSRSLFIFFNYLIYIRHSNKKLKLNVITNYINYMNYLLKNNLNQ